MGVILPPEYQQVEYLESTGTQSINLDVYANQDSIMICDVLFVKNNQSFYYGGGIAYGSKTFECYFWNPDLQFNEWSSTIFLSGSDVPNNIRATIYHSLNRYALTYAGGDVSGEKTFTSTFQTEYPVHLFALNRQSGVTYGKARIYGAEFYQGQTIVRKCIPCYRKSDDKPGMYDLVSETFLTNAGTGEFLVGPDVIDSISPLMVAWRRAMMSQKQPRLPIEYQEVPFIIGQGSQYIDTGYVLNSECRVQGRYDLYGTSSELRSVFALFGSRNNQYNNAFAIFNVTGAPRIDYGKTLATHSFSYAEGNNGNVLEFDLNAGIATVNGRTYTFADSLEPFTCPSTALIFAAHTENTVDTRQPKGEIVYLKITDENGTVVRDMIPCYRKSDNKPGMYDLANNQFYTNAGTGEFQLPS